MGVATYAAGSRKSTIPGDRGVGKSKYVCRRQGREREGRRGRATNKVVVERSERATDREERVQGSRARARARARERKEGRGRAAGRGGKTEQAARRVEYEALLL